jgi:GrpB-like predicted nucleotidyltransferase (UPF0157 family)
MIVIAPYDPAWPAAFAAEAKRIQCAFGDLALRIEHVGSTSVPGLAAKPVIDIQVSVTSLEPRANYHTLMVDLGYTHVPAWHVRSRVPILQATRRMAQHSSCAPLCLGVRARAQSPRIS